LAVKGEGIYHTHLGIWYDFVIVKILIHYDAIMVKPIKDPI